MRQKMQFRYDKEADAVYISLKDRILSGEVKQTIAVSDNIILDYDEKHKLIGIEILDASKIITKQALKAVTA
jgi:uncharacterized protein YuzE